MSDIEWRDISGYEGRYQVSNDGRVRNSNGRMLKPNTKSKRYDSVRLYSGGRYKYKDCLIHCLVAETFLTCPGNEYEVNHIDGNRYNNNVSNLEWVTHQDNMKHAVAHGLVDIEKAVKAHRKPAKCSNGKTYRSRREAANDLGVDESCISAAISGKVKTTGGYILEAC